ncbi:MAG: DUF1669 domain-containing protein [Elusimicrobia bacterium]|nr:DUF1669 domain-containing protein [Elusimicrobiota bacterium]
MIATVPGRAVQVHTVPVGQGSAGVPVVPPMLGSPLLGPRLDQTVPQAGLNGLLPNPVVAPQVELRPGWLAPTPAFPGEAAALAPAAPAGLSAVGIPALPAPVLSPAVVAPTAPRETVRPAAPDDPAANPGRSALERLAEDVPFKEPVPADLQGQKDFADRSFEFKTGARSVGSEGAAGVSAVAEAAVAGLEKGKGRKGSKKAAPDEPAPNADDGGGAAYPSREVAFNRHKFPSVALRPNVPVETKIIEAIDASRKSIRLALYEFKQRDVLDALLRARKRGVKVEIVLDYSNVFPKNDPDAAYRQRRSNEVWGLIREKVDFTVLRGVTEYGINHNKFAVFDGKMAEFGSYNWSFTAEHSHYENANFTVEKERVQALEEYWDYLRKLSVPFAQAKDHAWPKTAPLPPAESVLSVDFNGAQLPSYIFTPNGSAFEDAVVRGLDAAKKSVDVAMFAMRSTRIAQALARAKARGVAVRFVMDESQSQSEYFGPYAAWLAHQGVEIKVLAGPNPDSDYPMAEKTHHKFMVLDGKLVESGSANWTKRASMDNYENAQFLTDAADVGAYAFAFEHMFSIARAYPKPDAAPVLPTDDELTNDVLNPAPAQPLPPPPDLPPLPAARAVDFHGVALPSFALRPYGPVQELLVRAIDAARKSVKLALYEFTSDAVLDALRRAKQRGVKIEIVLDRAHLYTSGINHEGQPRKPKAQVVALAKEGFDVKVLRGKSSGVMHNKYVILDDELVAFGSYNVTDVAERYHFENFLFNNEAKRVEYYARYFDYKRDLAEFIDYDKLDEILSRTLDPDNAAQADSWQDSESADAEAAAGGQARAPFPPPPEDSERPIALNGETFPRQLFSPRGQIEDTLIRAIQAAKVSIEIAMFSFYSQRIADALLAVKQNRPEVKIRMVMDHSQSKLAKLDDWFAYHGFDIRLLSGPNGDEGDPMFEKMHNKFMIVDGKLLETGSFNFSPNAENNSFENANFIDDPVDLAGFVAYFERLWLQGWKAAPPKKKLPKTRMSSTYHGFGPWRQTDSGGPPLQPPASPALPPALPAVLATV